MGTDGGKFDVSDRVTADRLNRKTVFIGTGSEISALATYPGMFAYSTAAGSGFGTDILYERNSADNGWSEIIFAGNTQTLINKTLSAADNAITDGGTSLGDLLKSNGSKFLRWAKGTAHTVLQVNSAGTDLEYAKLDPENLNALTQIAHVSSNDNFTTTSNSFVDVTSMTGTITAKGNKAALVTHYSTNVEVDTTEIATLAITDNNNNLVAQVSCIGTGNNEPIPIHIMAVEAAPSAGSLTRKIRLKTSGGTARLNDYIGAQTSGQQFYVMEIA